MSDGAVPGTIRIRLGVLAIAALLVTVAALTTLVIVVAIRGADLLSVVALALAIIAFSAQLIIYVVQAAESAAANRRALELHAELNALLSELRERTGRTQQSVDTINSRLLEAVIGKTQVTADDESPRDFAERVAETYAEVSRSAIPARVSTVPRDREAFQFPDPPAADEAQRLNEYMSAWPPANEAADVETALRKLGNTELGALYSYATDLARSTAKGASLGPGLSVSTSLLKLGLIEKVKGWKLYTLNAEGRKLGRAFTAIGTPPPWALSLANLREEVARRENPPIDNRDPSD